MFPANSTNVTLSGTTTGATPTPLISRRTRQLKGELTDARVRNLKTEARPYKVFDGNSLYILVTPTGLRAWRWKYTFGAKEKLLALGTYPEVSLAQARVARDEAKRVLAAGVDPMEQRQKAKNAAKAARDNSFESIALAWHDSWRVGRHSRYAEDVLSRLKASVFPHLGRKQVSEIDPSEIVAMMERIHKSGAQESARKTRYTCGQIFRFAVARGLAKRNPAADFRPSDILPSRVIKHHARIDDKELPTLLRKIEAYQGSPLTRLAMKLLALTFVRTSELIEARWAEIDFDKAEWRIPAERMKMGRIHIIPLAPQAIDVLRTLHMISGQFELVFPGERDLKRPMSNNTILKALERMGYKRTMTGHGFRGLASTHLYEKQFPADHIELQLAHVKEKVRGAYDYSRQLPERKAMMEYWANFLADCLAQQVTESTGEVERGAGVLVQERPKRARYRGISLAEA